MGDFDKVYLNEIQSSLACSSISRANLSYTDHIDSISAKFDFSSLARLKSGGDISKCEQSRLQHRV